MKSGSSGREFSYTSLIGQQRTFSYHFHFETVPSFSRCKWHFRLNKSNNRVIPTPRFFHSCIVFLFETQFAQFFLYQFEYNAGIVSVENTRLPNMEQTI